MINVVGMISSVGFQHVDSTRTHNYSQVEQVDESKIQN